MSLPSPINAVPRANLETIQKGKLRYTWRDVPCRKDPFDLALYPMLIWRERPRTIIEIGTSAGGGALWLADTCRAFGLQTRVISVDIKQRSKVRDANIELLQGDGRSLGRALPDDFMRKLPRPLLVIEDADHNYVTTLAVLRFMDRYIAPGEYVIVEDGIVDSLYDDTQRYGGGPNRAIAEFLAGHSDYEVDRTLCDFFGPNVTWNTNGYIRRRSKTAKVAMSERPDFGL